MSQQFLSLSQLTLIVLCFLFAYTTRLSHKKHNTRYMFNISLIIIKKKATVTGRSHALGVRQLTTFSRFISVVSSIIYKQLYHTDVGLVVSMVHQFAPESVVISSCCLCSWYPRSCNDKMPRTGVCCGVVWS